MLSIKHLFEDVDDGLKILGFLVGLSTVVCGLIWSTKSVKLMRLTFAGEQSARWLEVMRVLGRAVWTKYFHTLELDFTDSLFNVVRVRVEREILFPRPKRVDSATNAEYAKALSLWRKDMTESFGELIVQRRGSAEPSESRISRPTRPSVLEVNRGGLITAGDVNAVFDRITRYFVALRELRVPEKELEFRSTLCIDLGFIAPLHLLAGLLARFDHDWREILDAFNREVFSRREDEWMRIARNHGSVPPSWIPEFRMIQKFIFDCWLQWGPSIPNSSMPGDGGWTSLQYGFGDENNSIEVVGDRGFLAEKLKALWQEESPAPMALPARVHGRLVHSKTFFEAERKVSDALQKSWRLESDNLFDGRILLKVESSIEDPILPGQDACYYSAYLWVSFVIMVRRGDDLQPLHPRADRPDDSAAAWLDLLPFFEHCNIACPIATDMSKRLLAQKAVSGIAHVVSLSGGPGATPLRFAYACAVDDPGDERSPWLKALGLDDAGESLRRRISELRARQEYAALFCGDDPIIRLDYYEKFPRDDRPYSTRRLIDHVHDALRVVESA